MLFVDGVSIGYATSHTLTISADTQDTSNKDEGGGDWASSEVSTLSWSISTENFFSTDGEGKLYADLFDYMIAKTELTVVFATKASTETDVIDGGWTPSTTPTYTGTAVITNLELNAPNGEYSTFSAEFQGLGALTRA